MLKLYSVKPDRHAEWHILVVAARAREARRLGWRGLAAYSGYVADAYTDVCVRLVKEVIVPDTVIEPRVERVCSGGWMCLGWEFNEDSCRGCGRYEERAEIEKLEARDNG